MSNEFKCPLCGNVLQPVGKKGMKMRCTRCRSVFDVSQLRQYYGMDSPSESGHTAHDYETAHMHAVEMENQRQKQAQQQSAMPLPGRPLQKPGPAYAPRPAQSVPPQTTSQGPVAKPGMLGRWIMLVLVVVFVMPTLLSWIISSFNADGRNTNSNANISRYSTTWKRDSNTNSNVNPNTSWNANVSSSNTGGYVSGMPVPEVSGEMLKKMNVSIEAARGKDNYFGDVLVIGYDWTNPDKYNSSFFGVALDKVLLDDSLLAEAYPSDGVVQGYKGDTVYSMVSPNRSTKTYLAYQIPEGAKSNSVVTVQMQALDGSGMKDENYETVAQFKLEDLNSSFSSVSGSGDIDNSAEAKLADMRLSATPIVDREALDRDGLVSVRIDWTNASGKESSFLELYDVKMVVDDNRECRLVEQGYKWKTRSEPVPVGQDFSTYLTFECPGTLSTGEFTFTATPKAASGLSTSAFDVFFSNRAFVE